MHNRSAPSTEPDSRPPKNTEFRDTKIDSNEFHYSRVLEIFLDIHRSDLDPPDDATVQGWGASVGGVRPGVNRLCGPPGGPVVGAQAGPDRSAPGVHSMAGSARTADAVVCPDPAPSGKPVRVCDRAGVPATNNAAVRSLRYVLVSHKISGGTRAPPGTATAMTLASLFGI